MSMHPYFTEQLAHGHRDELEREAARAREAEEARTAAGITEARPSLMGALRTALGVWVKALRSGERQSPWVAPLGPSRR